MRFKTAPARVKAAGEQDGLAPGEFKALVSVFGNIDSYGDVVLPGAFTDTLAEWEAKGDPIPVYWSHRMDDPDFNIGHVISAEETDEGLLVHGALDIEDTAPTSKAPQVNRLLKGRRVTQFSFAYDIVEGGPAVREADDGEEHYYELRKLRLFEVGPTPLGANDQTELLAAKAADTAHDAAVMVKAGRVLAEKHIDSLRTAQDAIGAVIAAAEATPDDQGKASAPPEAKTAATDEEPSGAKSAAPVEEPRASASVDDDLAASIDLLAIGQD